MKSNNGIRFQRHRVKLVLLDRDGTLLELVPYLHEPEKVVLIQGAAQALRKLQEAGVKLAVVSNQSGVGRGYFPEEDVLRVNEVMRDQLSRHGVVLDGIEYCPHAPDEGCECRKPSPHMLIDLCEQAGVSPADAVMVGDSSVDIEAGQLAGMATILVRTGYGEDVAQRSDVAPDAMIGSIANLPEWLLV